MTIWLMSVALTTQAVRDRQKTQTRRAGWRHLKEGDQLALCPKVRGVRRDNRELITIVDVVSVRRELLRAITAEDVVAEGFPNLTTADFITFFCDSHRGVRPESEITHRMGLSPPVSTVPLHGVRRMHNNHWTVQLANNI